MAKFTWLLLISCLLLTGLMAPLAKAEEDDIVPEEDGDQGEDGGASEQEAGEETEEEDLRVRRAEDIEAFVVLPNGPNLLIGEVNTILIGLRNAGKRNYNVSAIGGHIHSVFDHSYHIQNFSVRAAGGAVLPEGYQATVEYLFRVDPALDPVDVQLTAYVVLNSSGAVYLADAYNATVTLAVPPYVFNPLDLISWAFYLVLLLGVAYAVVKYGGVRVGKKGRQESKAPVGKRIIDEVPEIYTPKPLKGGKKSPSSTSLSSKKSA